MLVDGIRGCTWKILTSMLRSLVRSPGVTASPIDLLPAGGDTWSTEGWSPRPWRTAIARVSDRVTLTYRPTAGLHTATSNPDWAVGREGSITAADVNVDGRRVFTVASVYAAWEFAASRGYADAEAHRILSDLTSLMAGRRHRLIVAGDWNILRGYGEYGNEHWKARYDTVSTHPAPLTS